jgi:hypothetical protein
MLAQATKKEGLFSSQAAEIVSLQGRVDDLTAEAAHERGTGDEARARLAATLATLESTVGNLEAGGVLSTSTRPTSNPLLLLFASV